MCVICRLAGYWNSLPAVFQCSISELFCARTSLHRRRYLEEGLRSFQRGDFEQAVLKWMEASRVYERAGKLHEQVQR